MNELRGSRLTPKDTYGYSVLMICALCTEAFDVAADLNSYLKHLLELHHVVIDKVNLIANIEKYSNYWKKRFEGHELKEFCSVIETKSKADQGVSNTYFLLCDTLPEDESLRSELQAERRAKALQDYEEERVRDFCRECLFCPSKFTCRSELVEHMSSWHRFHIGHVDNIVYLEEFLDVLAAKLSRLECYFCDKVFKDRNVLKEHMRKKMHRKLNPKNKVYDKFYLVNYLELGKNWEDIAAEADEEYEEDQDWGDWVSDAPRMSCLFCSVVEPSGEALFSHMKDAHGFDFVSGAEVKRLAFHDKVKLVNYFRRCVGILKCPGCGDVFNAKQDFDLHLSNTDHWLWPEENLWNSPEYYFPTVEDDDLLWVLEDINDDDL